MNSFLITSPKHDVTVNYLAAWNNEITKHAKEKSIRPTNFEGKKANKKNVEKFLKKQKKAFVVLNGHGDSRTICGHNNEPIINTKTSSLLNSKIVYARACEAAKTLGVKAVEKGCIAFIGYSAPFGFIRDTTRETTPQKDSFAEPFKKASNAIVLALIKGNTAKQAVEKSRKKTHELISKYSASDAEPGYKEIRFWLFWNNNALKNLGKNNAKIKE